VSIDFFSKEVNFNPRNILSLEKWIKDIIQLYGFIPGDISFIFSSDEYLLDLNRQYLSHDYYTDIITFNYNQDDLLSGDIFISIDRIKENANKFSVSDNEELKRVIIHGILHLVGFNDEKENEIFEMRKAEDIALSKVKDLIII